MWRLASSSDAEALAIVDGTGRWDGYGSHYSRRSPGSKTFTGVGKEVVLVASDGTAVWAVVYQKTPGARGTGSSRGRATITDTKPRYLWRNMMFRNLGDTLSSDLIKNAVVATKMHWVTRYGSLPSVGMRTEVKVSQVSQNPGYCYQCAGWIKGDTVRGKLYLYEPDGVRDLLIRA